MHWNHITIIVFIMTGTNGFKYDVGLSGGRDEVRMPYGPETRDCTTLCVNIRSFADDALCSTCISIDGLYGRNR